MSLEPAQPASPRAAPLSVAQTIRYALDAVVASGDHLRVLSIAVVAFAVVVIGVPLGAVVLYTAYATVAAAAEEGGALSPAIQATISALALPTLVAGLVAFASLFIVLVQVPLWIVATVGGQLAGQPVTLREALRRSRQVFWRGLGGILLVGLATGVPGSIADRLFATILGPTSLSLGLQVLAGALFASPWVYVVPGIVLGGVDVGEAMRRSWRLARYRWSLALTIALLAVAGQVIVVAAAESAAGVVQTVARFAQPELAVSQTYEPIVAVGVYLAAAAVIGSIVFAVQVVQFAPQASGFFALTHYAAGLEPARVGPPGPLFQRRALLFYGAGVLAGLIVAAVLLSRAWP